MADRIDRRSFLARTAVAGAGVVAIGGTGALLEACGSSSSGSSSTAGASSRPNGISTAPPKRGGKLIFGTEAEEKGFDPTTATYDATGILYARTVFDPLATLAADGSVAPYLAQSITPNADYTVWTIVMRPNLVFHDNTPCDAAAVAYNLQAQKASLLTSSAVSNISTITAADNLTVVVTMHTPWVPFDYYLAGGIGGGQIAYIAAPSMLRSSGGTTHPVGTGPFVFEVWNQNANFTATRNPHYWRSGYPYLDTIEYRPIPDPEQLYNSLQSGSVDIIHTSVASVIKPLRTDTSLAYIDDSTTTIGEPDIDCVLLNLSKPPFDNPKIRQAAAMACSSEAYVKIITEGIQETSNGPFTPGSPFYGPTGYPAPDVAKATQLVSEVAAAQGHPVSLALTSTPDSFTIKIAEFIQQELEAVGMKVTIDTVEQDQTINSGLLGNFQAQVWRQFGAVDPDLNYIFWSPTQINASFSINMARNDDPAMETALQKGRQSPAAADRASAYQQVGSLMGADIPYIWNARTIWAVAAEPTVQNFNNPTLPSGGQAYGMFTGYIWPTQIWLGT
jgi:peptide/nickel transport system substrate-binding protein